MIAARKQSQGKSCCNQLQAQVEPIYWGDEVEGHVVQLDSAKKRVSVVTDGLEYLFELIAEARRDYPQEVEFDVMPEYGAWMIETVPSSPYCTINNLDAVLSNLRERSSFISRSLKSNQKVLLTSTFPLLGAIEQNFAELDGEFTNDVTKSHFIDDRIINPHPRFPTLSQNIRMRRGEKVEILVPLFNDTNTNMNEINETNPVAGFIYMDAMAFGMGSSCIQTTFSARNLSHARRLYD